MRRGSRRDRRRAAAAPTAVGVLAALAAGAASAPAPLAAQDTPTFSLGAGLAFPSGTAADLTDPGPSVAAWAVFPLVGPLGLTVDARYTRLHAKLEPALRALGIDPGPFQGVGGYLEGGYHWWATATLGLQLLVGPRDGPVVPWVQAAGGIARGGVARSRTWELGDVESHPGSWETAPAAAAAAGVDVRVASGVRAYLRGRWLVLFTDPERTTFLPLELGVSLQLEDG